VEHRNTTSLLSWVVVLGLVAHDGNMPSLSDIVLVKFEVGSRPVDSNKVTVEYVLVAIVPAPEAEQPCVIRQNICNDAEMGDNNR